jgi:hypothetical protein
MSLVNGNHPQFIKKQFDEFRDVTTSTHLKAMASGGFSGGGTAHEYTFRLRHVKSKSAEFLALDCESQSEDWIFLRHGELILNCDQDNVSVKFSESDSKTRSIGNSVYCVETGYYALTPDLLKKISSTNELKIRIVGKANYEEPDKRWCAKFRNYCLQFYHDIYDPEVQLGTSTPKSNNLFGERPLGSKAFKIIMGIFATLIFAFVAMLLYATFFKARVVNAEVIEQSPTTRHILQATRLGNAEYEKAGKNDSASFVSSASADIPKFAKGESYALARQKMIKAGWAPFQSAAADICPDSDLLCKDRPEMEVCAGTGLAQCKFLWKKEEKIGAIVTTGESEAVFESLGIEGEISRANSASLTTPPAKRASSVEQCVNEKIAAFIKYKKERGVIEPLIRYDLSEEWAEECKAK